MTSRMVSPLTFWSVQFVSCAFTPARRMDVGRVGVHPEVVTVRVAVKMEPEPVAADLGDDMTHDTHKHRQWEAAPCSAPRASRVESDFLKNPK